MHLNVAFCIKKIIMIQIDTFEKQCVKIAFQYHIIIIYYDLRVLLRTAQPVQSRNDHISFRHD